MKKTSIITLIAALSVISFSCSDSATDTVAKEILAENIESADYSIEGMVCAMGCAKTIQDKLTGMNGVAECNVNFEEGKAHVEYDKTQLSENDIVALIEGLADGQYKVSKWEGKKETTSSVTEEPEGNEEAESTLTEVVLPDFEIPDLFSLLFNQL